MFKKIIYINEEIMRKTTKTFNDGFKNNNTKGFLLVNKQSDSSSVKFRVDILQTILRIWLCESNTSGNFIPKFPPARVVLRRCPVSPKCLCKEQTLKTNKNIMKCFSFEKKRP